MIRFLHVCADIVGWAFLSDIVGYVGYFVRLFVRPSVRSSVRSTVRTFGVPSKKTLGIGGNVVFVLRVMHGNSPNRSSTAS